MSNLGNPNLATVDRTPLRLGRNASLRDGLFNDLDTLTRNQRETPAHRRMAELTLQGYTHQEIGAMMNYTPGQVSRILKQPFMRRFLIDAAKRDTNSELMALIEAEGLKALKRVVAVAETLDPDPDTGAVRPSKNAYDANVELVNRLLGKAVQPFRNDTRDPRKLTDDQLDAEIERLSAANRPS